MTLAPAAARNAALAVPTIPPPTTATSGITDVTSRDRRALRDPRQTPDDAVDLGVRVVVGQPDPDDATGLGEAQPLDQALRVEVAIPRRDRLATHRLADSPRAVGAAPQR